MNDTRIETTVIFAMSVASSWLCEEHVVALILESGMPTVNEFYWYEQLLFNTHDQSAIS